MKTIYGILFLLFSVHFASATHLKGGEILVKHVSGQTYEVKVRIYADAQSGGAVSAMQEVTVCLGNGETRNFSRTSVNPTAANANILVMDYDGSYTYPSAGIFQISTSLENRTGGMLNLANAEGTSMFIWTVIDTQSNNSTPLLPNLAFDAGIRQVFSVDLNPTVADQDSISVQVKRLSKPSPGACGVRMNEKNYLFPNEISSTGTFRIEGNKLVWKAPEVVGNYLFAMVVTEWRNGVVISESYREGSIEVTDKPGETVEVPPYESAEFGNPITSVPGLKSSELTMAVQAFPVPTQDKLTVKAFSKTRAVIRLQLIDLNGRVIKELSSKTPVISMQEVMDMSQMAQGIYLIRADNATHSVTQKVIR